MFIEIGLSNVNRLLMVFLSGFSLLAFAEDFDERCHLPAALCELQINFEATDKELNDIYKHIINSIKSGELSKRALVDADELKKSLIVSQRAWLQFKKANCDAFYTLNSGGSQRNEARMECDIAMTEARVLYLKKTY